MRAFRSLALVMVIALLVGPAASFAITTSGSMLGDETWSGTVVVTGDVTVPKGATLTIVPGTLVKFAALNDDRASGADATRTELVVRGTLTAEGTDENPIRFTSNAASPAKHDWQGIRADGSGRPTSLRIVHAIVEYAHTGIWSSTGTYARAVAKSGSSGMMLRRS